MGRPPPQPVVSMMSPGWNLGNSFDATPNETSWGNPTPNQALIRAVHAAGFNTLRIPVTWTNHIGAAPEKTIDSAWMTKVTQTAQWAVAEGMYVFGTRTTMPTACGSRSPRPPRPLRPWRQRSRRCGRRSPRPSDRSLDSRLMLECFNEPHNVNGNDAATQTDLNMYLEACVNATKAPAAPTRHA